MTRLTDEQLAHVAARIVEDQPKCHVCNGRGDSLGRNCSACDGTGFFALGTETMRSIVGELGELRTLLATPMPCDFDEPIAGPSADPNVAGNVVAWNDEEHEPGEVIAVGAALIRAALAAKGGE